MATISQNEMASTTFLVQTPGHLERIGLLFVVFLFCGMMPFETKIQNSQKGSFTFISLGDSYTIGESVQENNRWSVQLAGLLLWKGVNVENPHIIARTGWTTDELKSAIESSGNLNKYDLVSLMIGVNNQYRGQRVDRYRTEFRQLLQTAIQYASDRPARVLVLSIPDWGASPFAAGRDRSTIATQIDQFNLVARQECEKAGVAYVDITPLTRQATGDATQFASDGLHYSGKQMKLWAEAALPVVEKLLKK